MSDPLGVLAKAGNKLARKAIRQIREEQNQPRPNVPKSDRIRHDVTIPPPLGPVGLANLGHGPRPRKKR